MDILIRGNSDVTRGFAFLRYTNLQKRTLILNKFITIVITREIKVNFFLIHAVGFFLFFFCFLSSSLARISIGNILAKKIAKKSERSIVLGYDCSTFTHLPRFFSFLFFNDPIKTRDIIITVARFIGY